MQGWVIPKTLQELKDSVTTASSEVLAHKATMLIVVSAEGLALSSCSRELRADLEVVQTACRSKGSALQYASPELQDSKDFVLTVVSHQSMALGSASDRLREDRDVVMAAVEGEKDLKYYPAQGTLVYAGAGPRNDKAVVLAAVASSSRALAYASRDLQKDRDVVLAALKRQTVDDLKNYTINIVRYTDEELLGDEEIVLEAVRVDPAIIQYASAELRSDKEHILKAMRRGPVEQRYTCYLQADVTLQEAITAESMLGAAESVLALPGEEDAPVVTVALTPAADPRTGGIRSCQATLLSGATFTCSLLDKPQACKQTADKSICGSKYNKVRRRPAEAPGLQTSEASGRHSTAPSAAAPSLTWADLAQEVLAEFQKQVEVASPPERIFLLLAKGTRGDEAVAITPWDWNRPVAEFL